MAGQADGSIIIDTELNSDGFKAGSSELLAAIKSLSEEIKTLGITLKGLFDKPINPTVNTADAEDKIAALEAKVQELKAALNAVEPSGGGAGSAAPTVDMGRPTGRVSGLQQEVDALNNSVERLGPAFEKALSGNSNALDTFDRKAAALENKISLLREKMEAVAQTKYPTREYEQISAEVEKAGLKMETLLTRQERMQELGVKENSQQWRRLQYDLAEATRKYEELEAAKIRYESEGKAFQMGADTTQYQQMLLDIEAASQALRSMQNELGLVNDKWAQMPTLTGMIRSSFQSVADGVVSAFSTVKTVVTHPLQSADRLFAALIIKAGQLASSAARISVSGLVSGLKTSLSYAQRLAKASVDRLVSSLKSAAAQTKRLITGSKDYDKSLKKLVQTAKQFATGLLGARSVWMLLRKAISAYTSANEELANKQKQLWASVGNFLGPAIEAVTNLAAKAVSYLSAFLRLLGLTGSTAAKTASTAGKAASAAGKAAEKETNALKRQLASFDELNILSDNSTDSKSDSNSDAADGGIQPLKDAELPDWAKLIAEKLKAGEWEEAAIILTDQLNALVDKVDWGGIGDKLAYGVNGALTFLATAIYTFDWRKLSAGLATLLNHLLDGVNWGNLGRLMVAGLYIAMSALTGFFETLDPASITKALYDFILGAVNATSWPKLTGELSKAISGFIMAVNFKKIGSALGTAVQTILSSLNAALTNFDWQDLGTQLGNLLNSMISNINWGSLGDLFSGLLKAVLLTAAGLALTLDWAAAAQGFSDFAIHFFNGIVDAIASVNWQQIGQNVAGFIRNVDWGGVTTALFEAIGAALGGLAAFLWGLIEDAWNDVVDWWHDAAFEDGQFTITGLLEGILDAIKNIGSWVKEHIVDPFVDGFKKAFGIHSPSTVMRKMGGYVIDGLREGIIAKWTAVRDKVTAYAKEIWQKFKDRVKDLKSAGAELMTKLKDGLSSKWSDVNKKVISYAKEIWQKFKDKTKDLKSAGSELMTKLNEGLSSKWSDVKTKVSNYAKEIWQGFKDKANDLKSAGSELMTCLKDGLSGKWTEVKTKISEYATGIKDGFESKKEQLKTAGSNLMLKLKDGFNSGWSSVSSTISTLGTQIWQGFQNQVSNLKTVGANLMAGLRNGIVEKWNSVVNDVKNIAGNITDTLKKAFGVNSPSRIWAAIGGFLMEGLGIGLTGEKKSVLSTVSGIASAISDEMANGDYSVPPIDLKATANTDYASVLDGFADTVTNEFSDMLDRLQDIADRVTFSVPNVASGVIPYQLMPAAAGADGDGLRNVIEASNEELASVIIQSVTNATAAVVRAIEDHSGTKVYLDKDSLTQMVIDEINRKTRMMNANPLLV